MIQRGDQVLEIFLEETTERLDAIESGLLHLESCGEDCDPEIINSIFRDAHSVKAGSNLLKLKTIEDLAHKLENVLEMIRKKQIAPSEIIVTACLESVDKLRELIENVERSDAISTRLHTHMLEVAVQKTLQGE
ncbi:MAG: Hpt domain-containing protein [Pseudodesulfovibrio sp.]|uniref:Hpt domain-containing protein n=1 Tax=Pseudodesulfovibrio sp. TaxID=2035812 RepID=UPI003D1217CF